MFKIIATVIKFRLEAGLESELMATQFGFRARRSTTHAIHIARRIQEFAERAGITGTMICLDWEKAFDKITHDMLLKTIDRFKIPAKLRCLIQDMYENPTIQVKIEGVRSKSYRQNSGIRQ